MRVGILLAAVLLAGCAASRPVSITSAGEGASAYAEVRAASGEALGRLTFTGTAGGTLVRGTLQGLPAGTHGLHVHAVGLCEPPFTSAGPHFNPDNVPHGLATTQGGHAGDLPNIVVGQDGQAVVNVTARATLEGARNMLDADGAAIVVHAAADDGLSDPAGNAGARIACGVITR